MSRIRWVQGQSAPMVAHFSLLCGVGCAWNSQRERLHCSQIITAHQLLPLSHLFTQQLGLVETWRHTHNAHTLPETYLIIHQECSGEIEKHCCLGRDVLLFVSAGRVNTSSWIHTIHHNFKVCSLGSSHSWCQCAVFIYEETFRWTSTWQKSVASAIHMPQSNTSPVNYLWLLCHVSYTLCSILNT